MSGADLLSQLCSVGSDVPAPEPVEGAGSAGPLQIAAGGLVRFALRPWQLVNLMPTTIATVVKTLGRARNGLTMAAPFAAPATRFNTSVTADRNVALAQLDLDDVKKVKDRFSVTVNDVVMALCASVLRWFLSEYGELPARSLVAMVPVSVHDKSDRPGHNQLSGMFCSLETNIGDPAERLRAIARADAAAKNHSSAISPTLLQDSAQLAARAVFGAVFRLVADSPLIGNPVHNLIVSNVPVRKLSCTSWAAKSRRCIRSARFSRLRAEHHGDVAGRQVERGRHLLPGPAARPVAAGRRLRCRTRGVA